MLRVNEITQMVVARTTECEKETVPNIYETFTNDRKLAAVIEKKIAGPEATFESVILSLVEKYAYETFDESLRDTVTAVGLLLLEIKNQHDAANLGVAPNIEKINEQAAGVAKKFELLTAVLKAAAEDVDWEHVAERIIEVGKEAYEARKTAS